MEILKSIKITNRKVVDLLIDTMHNSIGLKIREWGEQSNMGFGSDYEIESTIKDSYTLITIEIADEFNNSSKKEERLEFLHSYCNGLFYGFECMYNYTEEK